MNELRDRINAAFTDRYAVERQLGAGGMATVYLAEDVKHDRKVAIKVLKPELAAVLLRTSSTPTFSRCSTPARRTVFSTTSCPTSRARRCATS
jgi:serine/threonine protein kinase